MFDTSLTHRLVESAEPGPALGDAAKPKEVLLCMACDLSGCSAGNKQPRNATPVAFAKLLEAG